MPSARLIVCEAKARFTPALRTALGDDARRLVGCGLRSTCDSWLAQGPASLVAVEADPATIDETLAWIARVEVQYPRASIVALLPAGLERRLADELEAALIEAGAAAVFRSTLDARRLVELAHRHFARNADPALGLVQQIWAELPWSQTP